MPLLEPASAGALLVQGDLLRVGPLHHTGHDGTPRATKAALGLVLSRDCVAAHKGKIIVAHVVPVTEKLFDDKALSELGKDGAKQHEIYGRQFNDLISGLQNKRDGSLSPDRFYLGALPGEQNRLVGQLDALSTVELPSGSSALAEWLATHRVATLSTDARRALGTRIFWAFTRVGFDDYEWLPDPDLRAVCKAGEAALNATRAAAAHAGLQLENDTAQAVPPKQLEGRQQQVAKLEAEVSALSDRIQPFLAERQRRESGDAE